MSMNVGIEGERDQGQDVRSNNGMVVGKLSHRSVCRRQHRQKLVGSPGPRQDDRRRYRRGAHHQRRYGVSLTQEPPS